MLSKVEHKEKMLTVKVSCWHVRIELLFLAESRHYCRLLTTAVPAHHRPLVLFIDVTDLGWIPQSISQTPAA